MTALTALPAPHPNPGCQVSRTDDRHALFESAGHRLEFVGIFLAVLSRKCHLAFSWENDVVLVSLERIGPLWTGFLLEETTWRISKMDSRAREDAWMRMLLLLGALGS